MNKKLKGVLEFFGFTFVIITFLNILALVVLFNMKVYGVELTRSDIIFHTITIMGAMNYILYKLEDKKNEQKKD